MAARKRTKSAAPTAEGAPSAGTIPSLSTYYRLGRSGLRVSPLCLGTMTFGKEWGWGNSESESGRILGDYLAAGGNFLDTANYYTKGTSEEYIGRLLKKSGKRDRVVLATKFTLNMFAGDPNGGGNGRKNIIQSCEASLRRLQTDYIDLYWLHMHDSLTPVEEVMSALDALVRAGKVRHIGLSDTPAWYAAKAQTLATLRGWAPLCAFQLEYSLLTRDIEREHVPLALEEGIGITPWSPLGGGMLTGKYTREGAVTGAKPTKGAGRLVFNRSAPSPRLARERNWKIVDELVAVAKELGRTPAEVALNWATRRPGVVSTIIGATTPAQLAANLGALEFTLPPELSKRLDEVSAPHVGFPYEFLQRDGFVDKMVKGGTRVEAWPEWYWPDRR